MATFESGKQFKVPIALDPSGNLVTPAEASKDEKHRCPSCQAPVSLQAGQKKARHFRHLPGPMCSPETMEHALAKRIVSSCLERWIHGEGQAPRLVTSCPSCGRIDECEMRGTFDAVIEEYLLPNGLRPDVVALLGGEPIIAVEVRQTHAVEEEKARRIRLPFIEVEAAQIIKSPRRWWAVKSSRCAPCEACLAGLDRRQKEAERLASQQAMAKEHAERIMNFMNSSGLEPLSGYWSSRIADSEVVSCGHCHKLTLSLRLPEYPPRFALDRSSMRPTMKGIDERLWEPRIVFGEWSDDHRRRREKGWLARPVIICLHCSRALSYSSSYKTTEAWKARPRRRYRSQE